MRDKFHVSSLSIDNGGTIARNTQNIEKKLGLRGGYNVEF